jgi:uncharacterized membrane protein YfcA
VAAGRRMVFDVRKSLVEAGTDHDAAPFPKSFWLVRPDRGPHKRIASAMSAGSIIGAALGGLAVAYAPAVFLKVILGCLLIATAAKTVGTKAL